MALNTYKFIKYVLDNKEQIIAEIKKYIETKLDQVEPQTRAKLAEVFGFLDSRHFGAIWSGYMKAMAYSFKKIIGGKHIKDTLWEQNLAILAGSTTVTEAKAEDRKGLGKDLFELKEHIYAWICRIKKSQFQQIHRSCLIVE
jgi:hypothetical protein